MWMHMCRRRKHATRRPVDAMTEAVQAASSSGWSSGNWSGYAVSTNTQGTYRSITGSWQVPTVQGQPYGGGGFWTWLLQLFGFSPGGTQSDTYSAAWIGIDGFNNSGLIQTGTAQNWVQGGPQYYAWWEILPSPEVALDTTVYPVAPGDQMTASIARDATGLWTITLVNSSQGWTFTKPSIQYAGPLTSAEWILEAPEVGGGITTLANYGTTTLTGLAVNGQNPGLTTAERGVMVQSQQIVSSPSVPSTAGDAFAISYGSTPPQPPNA